MTMFECNLLRIVSLLVSECDDHLHPDVTCIISMPNAQCPMEKRQKESAANVLL